MNQCSFDNWKVWKNSDGQTSTIRSHMIKNHLETGWEELVIKERLKNWQKVDHDRGKREQSTAVPSVGPFTLEGFYERLVCWVATDDQVSYKCHLHCACRCI